MPRKLVVSPALGLMMVMCCWGFVSGAAREAPHGDALDFGFVPAVVYETHAHYEPGAVDVLFHVVHAFLYTVQPNPFPAGESPYHKHTTTNPKLNTYKAWVFVFLLL